MSPFQSLIALTSALLLFGCMDEGSKTSAQATANAPTPAAGDTTKPEAAKTDAAKDEPAKTDAAKDEAEPLKKVSSPKRDLGPELNEVIELVEAGVGEEAILAFIENSKKTYELSADDILYLNDLGVSSEVIAALIRRSGTKEDATTEMDAELAKAPPAAAEPSPEAQAPQAAPAPAPPAVAGVAPQPVAPPAPAPAAEAAPPPQQITNNYFYDYLSPYGSWYVHPTFGYCWEPTVSVRVRDWRPYCHNGSWLYSDSGWYWHSSYSWGWAPFHYGRWFSHRGRWLWTPDHVWGPAWVSWRTSDLHCGWAPLPPGVAWSTGLGLTYVNGAVGVSFGFGLASDHFTFVSWNRFHDRSGWRHRLHREEAAHVYRKSTVVNNYINGKNNTIINEGIGRGRVAAATPSEVRKVALREIQPHPTGSFKGEQLDRDGATLAVYRPKFPAARDTKVLSAANRNAQEPRRGPAADGAQLAAKPDTGAAANPIPFPSKPRRFKDAARVDSSPARPSGSTTEIARPSSRPEAPSTASQVTRTDTRSEAAKGAVKADGKPRKERVEKLAKNEFVAKPELDVNANEPRFRTKASEPLKPSVAAPRRDDAPASRETPSKFASPKAGSAPKVGIAPQPITPKSPVAPRAESKPQTLRQEQPKYSAPEPRVERPQPSRAPVASAPAPVRPSPSYSPPAARTPTYQPAPSRPAPSYSPPPSRPAPSYSPPAAPRSAPSYSPPPAPRSAPSYSPPASRPAPSYSPPPSRSQSSDRSPRSPREQPR
ncbi:MAG: hypothetical protein HYY24_12305 [Verrucomicrobia bacterium]|nr:hypothetical protein [Verrucomicrobiota bacterium]